MVGKKYDVIVVGFGLAGACAAISAAEQGARVLVVDRTLGGGASAVSGGVVYAGGGTLHQRAAGYEDDPANMLAYLRLEAKGVVDDETLTRFCDESNDNLAWLESHGAQFASSLCPYKTCYPTDKHYLYFSGNEKAHPYRLHARPAPRGHRQVAKGANSGRDLWRSMRNAALRLGVDILARTRVDDLITEDGEVRGIRCRTWAPDPRGRQQALHDRIMAIGAKLSNWMPPVGTPIVHAGESIWRRHAHTAEFFADRVILAAGGFAFNNDMLRRYAPRYENIRPLGTHGDDGTGILLGVRVGGATDHLERVTAWRFMSPPSALIEGITVGVNGKRIANEDLYGATHSHVLVHEFDGKGFLILDADIWRRALGQFWEQTESILRLQTASMLILNHRKAATLERLAAKLGVSPTGLRGTVDAYNDAIARGAADPGHKATELCAPIATGPFYAIEISLRPSLTSPVPGLTLGGLKVAGDSGLVLDESGQVIPGLYAAGRNAVGICSDSYVSGLALADCVFSGKRAGKHAAGAPKQPRLTSTPRLRAKSGQGPSA
jgi:3-oxo-5alpha-steroid 4-dehydrogenase